MSISGMLPIPDYDDILSCCRESVAFFSYKRTGPPPAVQPPADQIQPDTLKRSMLPQQDAGVKPPDGSANPKVAKQKGGPLGGAHLAATSGGTPEQQAQRCPRCDSLNTKFCYYNNYSLSQPRHFCKNCRRYWTKGGALRNVPVGGGCRKNKRLKHRDPSCLAALADLDASGPSSILSSIGIPGFAPSTSSLIQELANEGHRLAFSRLGMQMLDKRFMTDNDHHHQHPASSTTQDLFTIGGPPPALGAFEPNFPALSYSKGDSSQPLLFHPQHASEFTPNFFDSMNSPSSLTPTLDHLSSFTAGTPTAGHHVNATSISNTANMDAAQMSLIHHMPMNGMQASHEEQQAMQASSGGGSFNPEEESAEMSLRRSKGKSIVSSLSDWGQHLQGVGPPVANANGVDSCFFVPPQFGAATDNGLWNVSWPEMHAALAGSAGAMLH